MSVHITDHALLRWLQRAHDIDMDAFRAELEQIAAPYAAMKVKHVEVAGVWFVFDNNRLVTVTPEKPAVSQMRRHDRQNVNHNTTRTERLNWKALQRKRNHK
jgi:hypothetical protein